MTMAVVCRRVDRSDLSRVRTMLAELEAESGPDYIGQVVDCWLEADPGGVYVAEHDGDVLAMTGTSFPCPGEAWLQGIRVLPRARKSGVGKTLANYQISRATEAGATVLRLAVMSDNEAGRALVTGPLGFRRERLWTVAWFPLSRTVTGGVRPRIADGPLRHDALRFLESRRYALACATPVAWTLQSYRSAIRRLAQTIRGDDWLLTWAAAGTSEPAMVSHVHLCDDDGGRYLLVDLLATTASRSESEQLAAGLLSVLTELAAGVGAPAAMFSVPTRSFAPVRPPARWLGLAAGEAREWSLEIYERNV